MNNFICIHGHFYQPPRENPWLEEIEIQDSAYPYPDWNQRISNECYAANAASRIMDSKGLITDIVNNYSQISFNFGPTLLNWLRRCRPQVYFKILEADRISQKHFSGHGAAMAQAYNHMIMPLANPRDKQTQVVWGIKDFESHFQRRPEGMWLPETAVDLATLEIMAENKILFIVLAPHQAKRTRRIGEHEWRETQQAGLDVQRPYWCRLPSGQKMAVFFYDGPISHDIAFGGILNNGEGFARRLTGAFPANSAENRLVNVCTDGESYGHHHQFGNMALSYCLRFIENQQLARFTIYGEYLEKNPPQFEVELAENSSWSCSHGVERWRADCGCRLGPKPWHQKWRSPLRQALDELRDKAAALYQARMQGLAPDPWKVRDHYIELVLTRSQDNTDRFLSRFFPSLHGQQRQVEVLSLLELQRNAMLMFTSCGWFFDDISGIESMQVLEYAARVVQLIKEISGEDVEIPLVKKLEAAPSNHPRYKNGADIYQREIKPDVIDLFNVAAHFAISSLFADYTRQASIYSYIVESHDYENVGEGQLRLVTASVTVRSTVTRDEHRIDVAALHRGEYNISCGVHQHQSRDAYLAFKKDLKKLFVKEQFDRIEVKLATFSEGKVFTLWDLFKNEQTKVLTQLFDKTFESLANNFRAIYQQYQPLMGLRMGTRTPVPKTLLMIFDFILHHDFVEALESENLDLRKLDRLAGEMRRWALPRDRETLGFIGTGTLGRLMEKLSRDPEQIIPLKEICALLRIFSALSLPIDLWQAQNIFFAIGEDQVPKMQKKLKAGQNEAKRWLLKFSSLGRQLKVKGKTT